MCGENAWVHRLQLVTRGSPPRVRGKPLYTSTRSELSRITPACAGKTKFYPHQKKEEQDHPRVCGENLNPFTHSSAVVGSPPRVRGKLALRGWRPLRAGITPACAGKTYCLILFRKLCQDHPRVCGENTRRKRQ